jgi:hypothetical protein
MNPFRRRPSAADLLTELLKREYQRGYDDGYEDGESVRPLPVTRLDSRRTLPLPDVGAAHQLGQQLDL